MKIHDDDFRLETLRGGTMCFPGDETLLVTGGGGDAFQKRDQISVTRNQETVKTAGH